MESVKTIALIFLMTAACYMDLKKEIIPNWLTISGIIWGFLYSCIMKGENGFILSLAGMILPLLLFAVLYYFRMIGAADIKLLCTIGSFTGPALCIRCIFLSVLAAAVISVIQILYHRNFSERFLYFAAYVSDYSNTGIWKPYMPEKGNPGRFSFAVPVMLSVFYLIAGGYI